MAESVVFWQWVATQLQADKPLTLLVVVQSIGSVPAKVGAKMAITPTESYGTIGGGMLEHSLVLAVRKGQDNDDSAVHFYHKTHRVDNTANPSGMICGGSQLLLVYPLQQAMLTQVQQLLARFAQDSGQYLCLSAQGLEIETMAADANRYTFIAGDRWLYRELLDARHRVYIVGGGHVSVAVSKILTLLDFSCVVLDDRHALSTLQANHDAEQTLVLPYAQIAAAIPDGPQHFILVMTHSHKSDAVVLQHLLAKNVAYIGVLGSAQKVAWLRQTLSAYYCPADLNKLHAPMGLPIQSHTPEEIAVSIAAELIQYIHTPVKA